MLEINAAQQHKIVSSWIKDGIKLLIREEMSYSLLCKTGFNQAWERVCKQRSHLKILETTSYGKHVPETAWSSGWRWHSAKLQPSCTG